MTKTESGAIYYERFRIFFFPAIFLQHISISTCLKKPTPNVGTCADLSDSNLILFVNDSPQASSCNLVNPHLTSREISNACFFVDVFVALPSQSTF